MTLASRNPRHVNNSHTLLIFELNLYFFQTKKKRSTRQREQADPMEEVKPGEINRASAQSYNPDANFVDDEELQAALARSRRAKLKKPKKVSPEELARQREFILKSN